MRVIIAGSRDMQDYEIVRRTMGTILKGKDRKKVLIISGGCPNGADALGELFAKRNGFTLKRFPAEWARYGKSAGPRRNAEMAAYAAEESEDALLVAFWDGKSPGTRNMIGEAQKAGLWIRAFNAFTGKPIVVTSAD